MDVITFGSKQYTLVITQSEYAVEIGLWQEGKQHASLVIDEEGIHARNEVNKECLSRISLST